MKDISVSELKNTVNINVTSAKSSYFSNVFDGQVPEAIRVIRRNKSVTHYDDNKIAVAMSKAFLAVEGNNAAASSRIHDLVTKLTTDITKVFKRRLPTGGIIDIEDIQDQVELALMRAGEHKVARSYVLYREARNQVRKEEVQSSDHYHSKIKVTMPNGEQADLPVQHIKKLIAEACSDLTEVDADQIFVATEKNIFNGVPLKDVYKAMIMATRPLIEQEPKYSYVTARLLLHECRNETLTYFNHQGDITQSEMAAVYPVVFKQYIAKGIELKRLDEKLLSFDLDLLGNTIKTRADRDLQFTYLGLQTLYDRYFIHDQGNRIELPQTFFMRVAMGLAIEEPNKNERAIEFYDILSSFDFMSSTPTLFNSGTIRSQLSSCYLTTVPDDLAGIYNAIKDNALLSKYAGGLGNDWTPVRGLNAHIEGTNGKSQGVVPFLKVANDTAVAVNQGGKRKGAVCAYMETWHIDIEEFLELRKNTGDERRRTHDMNTANWIPDLFMKRVHNKENWTLFSPDEVIDLHDSYGQAFEQKYLAYEALADANKIKNFKKVSAVNLWRKMLGLLFETGHPWITFKDPCNIRSPQQHTGVVHSSNLCTEITLNTSIDEIAVCNLGSINLVNHMQFKNNKYELDKIKLAKTIKTAIRMLDNVIDINFYSVPQAKKSNFRHRPIGLGIMGFQDALYQLDIPYASSNAIKFADESMEYISYFAIKASSDLAQERGSYETYEGSLWSKGILPLDSIKLLKHERNGYVDLDENSTLDWDTLRKQVKTVGIRNSNVMAIAPTATISNICGVSQSIEPTYQNLFVKSNLSGEFTVINPYLVHDLKAENLWDNVMVNDLKYFNGSVSNIDRIPQRLKDKYATAFEIDPVYLIDAAACRQKWIDQAQSLNLYMAQASGSKLDKMYRHAWLRGLKTTYYLRSLGATNAEKSTITDSALNAVQPIAACAIDNPDCEACQ
ncbi:MAG: ribonucleoside-diphosphate reductase subunit alpha [Gammaproteobacteria bacterium]|nr:ribonucleoside-diphosphate reductase subunit alpha [Gammaproteobacteria bacterium]